jgi:hypothetical protein
MGAGWEHVFSGHEHPAEPMGNFTQRAQRPQRLMVRDGGAVCCFPEVSQAKGPILAGTTGKRISFLHLLQGPLLVCLCAVVLLGAGCTVVTANRVFPTVAWSWSAAAQEQRREDAMTRANAQSARRQAERKAQSAGRQASDSQTNNPPRVVPVDKPVSNPPSSDYGATSPVNK